jgi:hypothetical protein
LSRGDRNNKQKYRTMKNPKAKLLGFYELKLKVNSKNVR